MSEITDPGPSIPKQAKYEEQKNDEHSATLSKSQLKKMKRKEKWEQVKVEKRKKEKERAKARKRELREKGELGPTRKQLRYNTMKKSSCKMRVAIDCGFDDYMSEKDIKMLVKQIQYSYSANRRATSPLQFYCCGIGGKTKQRLESLGDYKGWDIYFQEEGYEEIFDKSSIVYLSSESPNVLQRMQEDKVYVIGGLVDHNHQKGLCHRLAEEKGLHHAQLPIGDVLDMKTRKVLTINHVFEILLHYTETTDWQKAVYSVIPPRKGAVLKTNKANNDQTNDSEKNSASGSEKEIAEEETENSMGDSVFKKEKSDLIDKSHDLSENCQIITDKESDLTNKHQGLSENCLTLTEKESYSSETENKSANR